MIRQTFVTCIDRDGTIKIPEKARKIMGLEGRCAIEMTCNGKRLMIKKALPALTLLGFRKFLRNIKKSK